MARPKKIEPAEEQVKESVEVEQIDPVVDAVEELLASVKNAYKFAEILQIRLMERQMAVPRVVRAKAWLREIEKSLTPYLR